MPLDAVCLQRSGPGDRRRRSRALQIEKIQQPARDQVVLLLRGGRRLLLCASASQPRLHLTALLRDNPSQPPMFCMLLRKHLAGGRIVSLRQEPLERVVTLAIEAMNELGEMGRFSPDSGGHEPPRQPDPVRRRGAHHRLPAAGGL